ncbi:orotidine-5'-phosphate decarboxylase [Marinivivus vitaminiproducens]|uniref:orotidine-5'-phosphate decarboxylase n=1 Tax=Marinivivus vitaminiproducens TaxID=3035935 RepID=UPI00279C4513|nr:orotidine-5'-phosphate decarboxylase [Geminicoccaceae bacterium SCSIO 64248]
MRPDVYCALDRGSIREAVALAERTAHAVDGFKIGLELCTAEGPGAVVRALAPLGRPVFLDLKLHDIPNTVAGAVRSAARHGVHILTLHVAGGPAMMEAAAEAARACERPPLLIGITVMTSLDQGDLAATGVEGSVPDHADRLARLAVSCGLDGVVCSAREVPTIRASVPRHFRIVVPGIRPAGSAVGDQKRVMTPADAARAGADVLVVGRPIGAAQDPALAAEAIRHELSGEPLTA